ncbi:MAG: TIGR02646 family protein [Saprospiraceae bacterium]|nr:TIGR02646 family protein [Candidatus Opimibacter iunctus]
MKYIAKGESPLQFEWWKVYRQPNNWNDLDGVTFPMANRIDGAEYYSKEELREELLLEQGRTCCYCENRIQNHPLRTKVDHIEPREGDTQTARIFDYHNFGLSCNGGERDPAPIELHCDSAKKSKIIKLTPHNPACETEIVFTIKGEIIGLTERATQTINCLNLGINKLNNLREEAIAGFIFTDEEKTLYITKEEALKLRNILSTNNALPFKRAIICALAQVE